MMMRSDTALAITCALVLVGIIISSLEYFWLSTKAAFDRGGFWPASVLAEEFRGENLLTDAFGSTTILNYMLISRTGAAVWGIFNLVAHLSPVFPLLAVIFFTALLQHRMRWGGEGGDHMTNLVLIISLIGFGLGDIPGMTSASCAFLGAQLTLAYLSSGTAKLFGPLWRSGEALTRIMSNYTYGNQFLSDQLTRHSRWAGFFNYAVIAFQISFPLFFLLPEPFHYVYLAIGISFHLAIALVMRLHLFIYTFVAAYPCLIVSRSLLHEGARAMLQYLEALR